MSCARAYLPLIALVAACERPATGQPVKLENRAKVKFQMRRSVDDLKEVQRLLVVGKLDAAKARAFLLTQPYDDPGLAQWASLNAQMVDAARALVAAPTLEAALRREAQVALACASCHATIQNLVLFPSPPALPADQTTPLALRTRHQWAADRLWEGMIAGSRVPWRAGLDVLSTASVPESSWTDAPKLAERMHELARDAILRMESGTDTLENRASAYGEILVTCAGCHATPQRPEGRTHPL
jgi:cytochrome c553